MRIIVNFIQRDGIAIHRKAEDAKTVVSGWSTVPDQPTLEKLLRYAGATDTEIEEVRTDLRRWSHGGVHLTLAVGRRNLLKIRPEYAKPLGLW